MSTIITLPNAVFTKALEHSRSQYKYYEMIDREQKLFDLAFTVGWTASKEHTFQILESIAQEGENGRQ